MAGKVSTTPSPQQRATAASPGNRRPPKSIFLFSDGTGNSSAKLFKTNVWRMYEALELGPPVKSTDRVQIAYYENGVGTSNFRPLRLLGGIFGFGLKGGVLRLYRYLCQNYRDGDTIYAFGFSRGAFTIRLLVGLITSQGLVQCDEAGDLPLQARAAYRELCRGAWPNKRLARDLAGDIRRVRDWFVRAKRRFIGDRQFSDVVTLHPDIQFVGVWDTVAAYGGPFAEITRGVDDWVWPLTLPNYALSPKVVRAAHALALDDERDAFMPLLWDEVREANLVAFGEDTWVDTLGGPRLARKARKERKYAAPGRLTQMWFAGMHSDVGGGYPDESLSYVSLLWMMDEAAVGVPRPERLRFLPRLVERAKNFANPYGPMHDSRAGAGAYYRYQPRKIAAWLEHADKKTLALRDPESPGRDKDRNRCPDRGLLKGVSIHESVIARIASGTDHYAPIAVPDSFAIKRTMPGGYAPRYLSSADFAQASKPAAQASRAAKAEAAWDQVWYRRKVYYFTVLVSLLLIFFPLLAGPNALDDLCSDDRCFAARPIRWIDQLVPAVAGPWTGSFARHPILFLAMATALVGLLAGGKLLSGSVHDRSWRLWNRVRSTGPSGGELANGRLADVRTRFAYQWLLHGLRWHFFPLVTGAVTWILLVLFGGATVTQLYLIYHETRAESCAPPATSVGKVALMGTSSVCTDLKISVEKDQTYLLTLQVVEPWQDKGPFNSTEYAAMPDTPADLPWYLDVPGQPFRRVIAAGWLEPALRIRWKGENFGHGAHVFRPVLKPIPEKPYCFGSEFKAKRDGDLAIFVNDVRLPLDNGLFYKPNEGTAWVSVKPGVDDGTERSYDCGTPRG